MSVAARSCEWLCVSTTRREALPAHVGLCGPFLQASKAKKGLELCIESGSHGSLALADQSLDPAGPFVQCAVSMGLHISEEPLAKMGCNLLAPSEERERERELASGVCMKARLQTREP